MFECRQPMMEMRERERAYERHFAGSGSPLEIEQCAEVYIHVYLAEVDSVEPGPPCFAVLGMAEWDDADVLAQA